MHLLLTLGHNASAVTPTMMGAIGYEQERFTPRIKSSSAFPVDATNEIFKHKPPYDEEDNVAFVSHWFDDFQFPSGQFPKRLQKYWNKDHVKTALTDMGFKRFVTLNESTTHHDAHAWSGVSFWENHSDEPFDGHIIVADGFGNRQEVLSVYRFVGPNQLSLVHRVYGYANSLGLMYQYATSAVGMKENQDEYKFLGYESHIGEVLTVNQICDLKDETERLTDRLWQRSLDGMQQGPLNGFLDEEALAETRQWWHAQLSTQVHNSGACRDEAIEFKSRVIVGFFIQHVLETYYSKLIRHFKIKNIICAGGVHLNVKLNHHVLTSIPGQFCVVPLCGDQGAAIGLYRSTGRKFPFKDLTWGKRSLHCGFKNEHTVAPGVAYFTNRENYADCIADALQKDMLVNTITGSMEFGPRALCNTSTLALPTEENVNIINTLNGRDTVMPMAPVVLENRLSALFQDDYNRIVGSMSYMITTLDFRHDAVMPKHRGIMHPYPNATSNKEMQWSGRPQVVNGHTLIGQVLKRLDDTTHALINTSLNVHGRPIVFSLDHAFEDFRFNCDLADKHGLKKPILVIGNF